MTIVENPFAGQESNSSRELRQQIILLLSPPYGRITDICARSTDHI